MGHTHYFCFRTEKGKAKELELTYQRAVKDCQRIIKRYYAINGGLSGYTAHTTIGQYGGLCVNGKGSEGCEEFSLPEHFSQAVNMGFQFCKTNRRPYDLVVSACLAVLKHRLGDNIDVSSDGHFNDGINFAREVTRLALKKQVVVERLGDAV